MLLKKSSPTKQRRADERKRRYMPEIAKAFCWGIGIFLSIVCIFGIVGTLWIIADSEKEDSEYTKP